MAIDKTQKEALVDALTITLAKTNKLEIVLRFQGKTSEADDVQARGRKLSAQIDRLLARIMEEWLGQAATLEATLKETNAKLQGAIRDIKKKVAVGQKVVQAIGHIDDAIAFAGRLLK